MVATKTNLGALVLAEHETFVRSLEALDPGDWDQASWCRGWTVCDVVIHVAGHIHHSVPLARRFGDLVRSGLRPPLASTREVHRHRGVDRDALLEWLSQPLGEGMDGTDALVQLAELTIHGEDIRRPLGFPEPVDDEVIRLVLDHGVTRLGSVAVAGARRRARGLLLQARDVGWTYGAGPRVSGPAMSLALVLNGRAAALGDLDGPGVPALRLRMPEGT